MKFPSIISLKRVDQEKLGKNRTRNQIIIIVSLKCTNKTVNQAEDVLFMIIGGMLNIKIIIFKMYFYIYSGISKLGLIISNRQFKHF